MRAPTQPYLAAHLAVPTYRHLSAVGLISPENAATAMAQLDVRAAISGCGRKARLLSAPMPGRHKKPTRGEAAAAIRASLHPLLLRRARWPVLLRTARHSADSALTAAEIDGLIRDQIAAFVRQSSHSAA